MTDEASPVAPSLTTTRLHLRLLDVDDAPGFFEVHADPAAMRYWSSPVWTDPARAVEILERDQPERVAGTAYRFGLFDRELGGLVGCCSLHHIDRANARGEVGYILRRTHWGRGLMHEVLVAAGDIAFETLALRRLEADVDPRNAASARTVTRLGFVYEALMRERWRVADEVSDSAIYGLLRDDWNARRTAPE